MEAEQISGRQQKSARPDRFSETCQVSHAPTLLNDTRAGPVQAGERIEFVDILRGLAILGILVVNMAGYNGMSTDPQVWDEPLDRAILLLTRFFVEAKFYSLFSFLFGWGMAVQMARARARGSRFQPTYLRRLAILLIFGLLHAVLLWYGDILYAYAIR